MALIRLLALLGMAGGVMVSGCAKAPTATQRDLSARLQRAERLISQAKTVEARSLLQGTLLSQPEDWQVAFAVFNFWKSRGRVTDALAAGKWILDHRDDYTQPSRLPPEEACAVALTVASLVYETKSPGAALSFAELAYQLDPTSAPAANDLAWTLADGDIDPHRALPLARQAVRGASPAEAAAYMDTLGWAYYKVGNVAQSIQWLEKAIRKAPDEAELRSHLAVAQLAAKNVGRAYVEAHKALYLHPGHKEAIATTQKIKRTYRYDPPGPL